VQAAPADGFRSGATTIKIGGFIKLTATNSRFSEGEVATNSLGRDFYLPQSIPVGSGPAARVQDFSAKQSRLWLNLSTDVAGHAVKGYVETDFQTSPGTQGSQRTTNGYNLALRRAYIQVDKFTFGQDWSTFQYVGALPESTDFVGATEGTVFVRRRPGAGRKRRRQHPRLRGADRLCRQAWRIVARGPRARSARCQCRRLGK
jgi:hypothetical protein